MNRRHLALASLLAILPLGVSAQQKPTVLMARPTTIEGCPVGFTAGHSKGLTALRSTDNKPGVPTQSLNIAMDNATGRNIVSAQITVHGLSQRYRLTPLSADTVTNGDLSKRVALNLSVDSGKRADTDFRVYGFTSVQRIDLDSLIYADGTTWTAPTRQRCSVVPSGLMLVAAAQ